MSVPKVSIFGTILSVAHRGPESQFLDVTLRRSSSSPQMYGEDLPPWTIVLPVAREHYFEWCEAMRNGDEVKVTLAVKRK